MDGKKGTSPLEPGALTTRQSVVVSQSQPVPVNPSGFADIVGFGDQGVTLINNSFRTKASVVVKEFGNDQGWCIDTVNPAEGLITPSKGVINPFSESFYTKFNPSESSLAVGPHVSRLGFGSGVLGSQSAGEM
ncbi:hypothetical protein BJ165DRAFT_1410047 [Panaeolus papilionaceus]|nr:hypothetical protein BJ165DRAFT_1410047 [Panaeolus papilionaceus]